MTTINTVAQRVLLASRSPEELQGVREGLEAAGVEVIEASDLESVLTGARKDQDLVIVSEDLNGGSGADVCAVLEGLPGHAPLLYVGPILVPGADAVAPPGDPPRIVEQALALLEGSALIQSLGSVQQQEKSATSEKPAKPLPKPEPPGNAETRPKADASAKPPEMPWKAEPPAKSEMPWKTEASPKGETPAPAPAATPAKSENRPAATNGPAKPAAAPPPPAAPKRDRAWLDALLKKVREADYFDILGVHVDAPDDAVRSAHASLRDALEDVEPGIPRAQLEEVQSTLDEALDVLTQPALRAAYTRNRP